MTPCLLLNENIFRFSEVRSYPSIHNFGLKASPLQHELGSGSPAACNQRYVSKYDSNQQKILSQKFFRFFSGNYFSPLFMIPCSLLIENIFSVKISQHFFQVKIFQIFFWKPRFMIPCSLLIVNIFSVFRSPQLPLDTQFWTRGLPFAIRARKREPCN